MNDGSLIEALSLTKVYGGKAAVDGIDFQVKPGAVTGFLGPNGAGKSTTMGTVTVGGRSYQGRVWPLYEVGALLDARAVHPGRSAYDHLHSLAAANGIARARVGEVLEQVGLTSVARKRVGGYSLGMFQRLGIAGALLGDPGRSCWSRTGRWAWSGSGRGRSASWPPSAATCCTSCVM
jgi:ABC-2 type transport system ATP-binding protein